MTEFQLFFGIYRVIIIRFGFRPSFALFEIFLIKIRLAERFSHCVNIHEKIQSAAVLDLARNFKRIQFVFRIVTQYNPVPYLVSELDTRGIRHIYFVRILCHICRKRKVRIVGIDSRKRNLHFSAGNRKIRVKAARIADARPLWQIAHGISKNIRILTANIIGYSVYILCNTSVARNRKHYQQRCRHKSEKERHIPRQLTKKLTYSELFLKAHFRAQLRLEPAPSFRISVHHPKRRFCELF